MGLYNGFTPLDDAAGKNQPAIANLLLARGADANSTTRSSGLTPLLLAAHAGAQPVVDLLLAHGADPHARDKEGRTARRTWRA